MIFRCLYGDRKDQIVILDNKTAYWPKDGLVVNVTLKQMNYYRRTYPNQYLELTFKEYNKKLWE